MDDEKLDALAAEREKVQDRLDDINSEIAKLADQCPRCRNYHWPHCGI